MTPTSATARLHPIPEPPRVPLVGHVQLLTAPSFTEFTLRLAQRLGPVFGLRLFGQEMTLVGDQALVAELCDESRFHKKIDATLKRVRLLGGHGLFTAHDEEPNWKTAHDLLMPAFSLGAMRGYHDTMVEVGHRLLDRWENHPTVDVPGDATRLTLDTIGLCGFGYDFECFSRSEEHPFVSAMVKGLAYTQETAITPPGTAWLRRRADTRFEQDRQTLTQFVDDAIAGHRGPTTVRTCWTACCSPPRERGWTSRTSVTRSSPSSSPATRPPAAPCPSPCTSSSSTPKSSLARKLRSTRSGATRTARHRRSQTSDG